MSFKIITDSCCDLAELAQELDLTVVPLSVEMDDNVYTEGDITYYPDLIKVTVALDSGKIIGIDARGYLTNHHKRENLVIELTQEQAMQSISPNLSVMSSKLCVIPSSGKNEFFCYEFHCVDKNGQEYLIYIDTQTGQEDNILLLLYSDNGALTK